MELAWVTQISLLLQTLMWAKHTLKIVDLLALPTKAKEILLCLDSL
jgi:hypothetical protein